MRWKIVFAALALLGVVATGQAAETFTPLTKALIAKLLGFTTVTNNAALKATAFTAASVVHRQGFTTANDGGDAFYSGATGACTLNNGAGDNGYEVVITGDATHCWKLIPEYPLRRMIWGLTGVESTSDGVTFTVATTGNDYGGKNSCVLPSDPCKTIKQAVLQYYRFLWYGYGQQVSIGAGTFAETISVISPLINASTGWSNDLLASPMLRLVGAGSSTVISGDALSCGTIISSWPASQVSVEKMTLNGNAAVCQSTLFAEQGGIINVYDGVVFGPASQQHMHAETGGSQILIWRSYTVTGAAAEHWGVTTGGQVDYNPNAITITLSGTPAFTYFGFIQHAGLVMLANDTVFAGTATGGSCFIESFGGIISNNNTATPIPGNARCIVEHGGFLFPETKLVATQNSVGTLTGLGTTGTASITTQSSKNMIVTLSPTGASMAAAGTFTVTLATRLYDYASGAVACTAQSGDGTGTWTAGNTINLTSLTSSGATPQIAVAWTNGGAAALTAGLVYKVYIACPAL